MSKVASQWSWGRGAYRRYDETGAVCASVEMDQRKNRWMWSALSTSDLAEYRDQSDAQAKADAHLISHGFTLRGDS